MKKPSRKVMTVAGLAIVGTIATTAIVKRRQAAKNAPPKPEPENDANLFI